HGFEHINYFPTHYILLVSHRMGLKKDLTASIHRQILYSI
ncbi:hypothetical protein ABH957_004950, partial [Bacillus sp. RC242]